MPERLVLDSGTQFTSAEFTQFLEGNQIKHILSAPYHPASNGLAECFVQTVKQTLKASSNDGKSIHHHLAEFLFEYRATPHATTNVATVPETKTQNTFLYYYYYVMEVVDITSTSGHFECAFTTMKNM